MYNQPPFYRAASTQKSSGKIVSEKEAHDRLSLFLNGRMNTLLDHLPASKIRAELQIDLEKSYKPSKSLSWIVEQVVSLDPDHHFEYDKRDDHVKFVPNGESCLGMPAKSESVLSMHRPSSSDRPKGNIPVGEICDMINTKLREAKVGKVSVDRIHENSVVPKMDREDLMEFIKTHIETGDICGFLVTKNAKSPFLEYRDEGGIEKKEMERLSRSMANASVEMSGKGKEEDKWRDDERRIEDMKWKNDEEAREEEMAIRLREDVKREFPFIRNLPYLIYLLQKVIRDMGKGTVYMETFKRHLDDLVGGSFDYSLFGLTVFAELIYYKMVEVEGKTIGNVKIRLNPLITEHKCRVELLKGYLAGQIYNYTLKNGPSTYKELYQWMDEKDSRYLHEQFPKWNTWGEKEKIEDVKAQYKSHWEVFVQIGEDSIDVNPSFIGLVASPFLFH